MPNEIERRFLIDPSKLPELAKPKDIHQYYLNSDPERTVRVRLIDNQDAFVTIKGKRVAGECPEFEYPVPLQDGQDMVALSEGYPIHKERFIIPVEGHNWEVDKFLDWNDGLWIAEIELGDIEEDFVMPEWVVKEITDDPRYANGYLSRNPYTQWDQGREQSCSLS